MHIPIVLVAALALLCGCILCDDLASVECQLTVEIAKGKDGQKAPATIMRKENVYMDRQKLPQKLECFHPKAFRDTLRWKRGDNLINCSKSKCHLLDIKSLQPLQQENYTCFVQSNNSNTACKEVKVNIIPVDIAITTREILPLLTNASVDNITLRCEPSRKSLGKNFTVTWKFDNRPLENVGGHIIMDAENEFHIRKPKSYDSGVYLCTFNYTDGTEGEQDYVQVFGAPAISKHQRMSKDADEGSSVVFGCHFYGHPVPVVKWSRGDKIDELSQSPTVEFGPYDGVTNGSIKLSDLKYSDRNSYICIAKNTYGEESFSTLIRVKSKLAPLWPFLGILFEVIALVTIILLFERRRKMKAAEETDDEVVDHSKRSCQSTPDTDLRLRKK